jgi:hypothetical protein
MRNTMLLGIFTVAVSGCVSRTGGQLGHASFSYEECLFGCATSDASMAAGGAHASINVTLASGYSFAAVHSTNSAAATFTIGGDLSGTALNVTSGSPGSTLLQLLDGNGRLVDQTTITVEATAKLAVTQGWTGTQPLILAGSPQSFHVTTTDANGRTTIGTGSVAFTLAGTLTPTALIGLGGDAFGFEGVAGSGSVVATTPSGASARLDVIVVPQSALISLNATKHSNSTDSSGTYANVDITANSAGGPVYGAQCNWTTSDPSVTVRSQSVGTLERMPIATTQLTLGKAGSFVATCTIGSLNTSVQLTR